MLHAVADERVGREADGEQRAHREQEPPERLPRLAVRDDGADERERQPQHEERRQLDQIVAGREVGDDRCPSSSGIRASVAHASTRSVMSGRPRHR